MDNPDSTVEHNMFQGGFLFNPQSKRLRKDEGYASAFTEVFPQKCIRWSSPLVHSPPTRKFCFNFGEKKPANKHDANDCNDVCLGAKDTGSSNIKLNPPFEASGKPANVSSAPSLNPSKKNSKNQFPPSDQNYAEEINNNSFYEKIHEFDALCDLEDLGLTIQKKDSANKNPSSVSSTSYVGKYYSELLRNSQNKSDQNESKSIPKNETSNQTAEKKPTENVQQLSQNLFSQNDFLPRSESQRSNILSERNANIYDNMKLFTQPVPMEYQYNHNVPRRNHIIGRGATDAFNASFVGPSDCNFALAELTQRRHFNPYLDEYRSNAYFSQQTATRPHMCCGHNQSLYPKANSYDNPDLETISEVDPCWDHPDYGRFLRMRQARYSCVCAMPENYIDHCSQPVDDHRINRDLNRYSRRYFEDVVSNPANNRSMFSFEQAPLNEKENIPEFNREARSYTPFFPEASNTQQFATQNVRKIYVPTPQRQVAHGHPAFQSQINFEKNMYVPTTERQVAYGPSAFPSQINFEKTSSKENMPDFKRDARPYTPLVPEPPNTHQLEETQMSSQNLRKIYAQTPKRQLIHCPPRFQSQIHPSTSAQRRVLNFDSFEERLNNSIIPCDQGSSSSAARNQRCHQPSDEQRGFVTNGFILANNQNRTQ